MSQTDAWMRQAVGGAVTGTLVMSTVGFLENGLTRLGPTDAARTGPSPSSGATSSADSWREWNHIAALELSSSPEEGDGFVGYWETSTGE